MADLGHQPDTPGKRDPPLKNCLHRIGLWGICLLADVGGVQFTVGGIIPTKMAQGCIREVAEHEPGSKQANTPRSSTTSVCF